MPVISVIVPVYGVEAYLSRCIDSILAQSLRDFELILVDDGSPDRCGEICEAYARRDSRIHVLHQENRGLSGARNAGVDWAIAQSSSQWLSFVDGDDRIHPRFLELLLAAANECRADISQCEIDRAGTPPEAVPAVPDMAALSPEEAYRKPFAVSAVNKLYRKTCFAAIRYPVGRIYEDVWTTYRLLFARQRIAYVDAPLYIYSPSPESITRRSWTPARLSQVEAWEEQLSIFENAGSPALLRHIAMETITALGTQVDGITESDALTEAQRTACLRMLRKKLRRYLRRWHVPFRDYRWLYEKAYPRAMWCYWTWKGICGRLWRFRPGRMECVEKGEKKP